MAQVTHGALITVTPNSPTQIIRKGLQGRSKQLTLINKGSGTVIYYWGGGDPNNLPVGWTWDTSDADEKGYTDTGEAILVPGGVHSFLAQSAVGNGNNRLQCIEP